MRDNRLDRLGLLVFGLLVAAGAASAQERSSTTDRPPNIVYFLVDDMGWRDVGFHGSEIRTPVIDRLAGSGTRLEAFYAMPMCTPTRASLLTGRYPIRYGLQTGVIADTSRYGLSLDERTLPQALHEVGYRTALVGKWHLGDFQSGYVPTRRGFDSQYGLHGGYVDHWEHTGHGGAPDWYRDDRPIREEGYTTDLIVAEAERVVRGHDARAPLFLLVAFDATHEPLQAPERFIEPYRGIADEARRVKAAMTAAVDEGIGRVLAALDEQGIGDRTLVLFSSDNGGPEGDEGADNGPLRGEKMTVYEGGVRVPAVVAWPGRVPAGAIVTEPLHVVDLYPTLLGLAGASLEQPLPLDGRDAWATIVGRARSPHEDILINAEAKGGALRSGRWKLVVRRQGGSPRGKGGPGVELYDLETDPGEERDVASREPERTKELLARYEAYELSAATPLKQGGPGGGGGRQRGNRR